MRRIYPNAIKYFAEHARIGEQIALHEDGEQSRDFVDIRDLGDAHLAVLDNPAAQYQAINVGSGNSVKIRDLARMAYKIIGTEFKPIFQNEFRPFTPRNLVMSIKKIKDTLGWHPEHTLEESVLEYVDAVTAGR
jgi:dTDP-L-rhamnose 4-epimerase